MLWLLLQSTSVCYRVISIPSIKKKTTYNSLFAMGEYNSQPREVVFDLLKSAHTAAGNLVPILL